MWIRNALKLVVWMKNTEAGEAREKPVGGDLFVVPLWESPAASRLVLVPCLEALLKK